MFDIRCRLKTELDILSNLDIQETIKKEEDDAQGHFAVPSLRVKVGVMFAQPTSFVRAFVKRFKLSVCEMCQEGGWQPQL